MELKRKVDPYKGLHAKYIVFKDKLPIQMKFPEFVLTPACELEINYTPLVDGLPATGKWLG